MADTSRRRTGELLKVVCQILWDKPEGMQVKDIVGEVPKLITLTDYEQGSFASSPNSPRYNKILRFGALGLAKAGWLIKSKGRWYLTEEGKAAFKKFPDAEAFYREVQRLYQIWKRSRPERDTSDIDNPEEGSEKAAITFEEAEEKAWEQIQAYLRAMNPYDFQELVADLLRVMGYFVSWIAPPGKDRGVDIIAHNDPLGTSNPRIKVQVKRREGATAVDGLRSFLSVLGADDVGIFVSTGGFTSDAMDEARSQERRKVTLLDLQGVFDLWVEHYGKLSQEARQRFPLRPLYFLAPEE